MKTGKKLTPELSVLLNGKKYGVWITGLEICKYQQLLRDNPGAVDSEKIAFLIIAATQRNQIPATLEEIFDCGIVEVGAAASAIQQLFHSKVPPGAKPFVVN